MDGKKSQYLSSFNSQAAISALSSNSSIDWSRTVQCRWQNCSPSGWAAQWVPSHAGVPRNETVDGRVKREAESNQPEFPLALRTAPGTRLGCRTLPPYYLQALTTYRHTATALVWRRMEYAANRTCGAALNLSMCLMALLHAGKLGVI
ncbi:hypothetical protein CDAR_545881 [Caerostris darwini]|uniref:RNase H type-1 domain-containing protein n=1 Tax=Caerostris darwini TaxID=1538125 RepID=A0AAV4X3H6_9ARAC|nr:hypothetical protein CDAR_419891 [Caerostris darwini]GIY89138.1 hypothetical protein CDAR_545881 [Caerostris darwini]